MWSLGEQKLVQPAGRDTARVIKGQLRRASRRVDLHQRSFNAMSKGLEESLTQYNGEP